MMSRPRLPRRTLFRLGAGALLGDTASSPTTAPSATCTSADPGVWVKSFAAQRVWGYVDKHSIRPGERCSVMLSTGPMLPKLRGHLEFFRVTHKSGGVERVWVSGPVEVTHQPASKTAASVGANWPPSLEVTDTAAWQPGYYSADFVDETTGVRDLQVAQIVVRDVSHTGAVLLRLGTNTYQAYNAWGGHSLYPTEDFQARGVMVSFDRPTLPAFFEYDAFLTRWLESLAARLGFGVDYATNFDVHRDPELLGRYPLVISGSHDEYWSKEEFDAFEHRIIRVGGNTIFFGANPAYFQMRYIDVDRPTDGEDFGRQMLCYKSLNDPIARRGSASDASLLVTARFRDGNRRPETMLAGVAYQNWFSPGSAARWPYLVVRTNLPFFVGTGWQPGDVAADVVGYEWDNRDPAGDGARLWDAQRSRIGKLSQDEIVVLFRGSPVAESGESGTAEAVYFRTAAGAQVFSAGTTRWAWGLGKRGFASDPFRRFNENLVRAFLARGSE